MPNPHVSTAFGDLLDPRFQAILFEWYPQLPSMLAEVYNFEPTNKRADLRYSQVGTLPDWTQFTGTVTYASSSQGYDTTLTPLEWTSGFQVERKLFDDDQYQIMDQRPKGLATSAARTREKHGARLFNNAFSVDSLFYVNSEGVSLCNNSHTTTSGASTASGFDNLSTAPLTATAVAAGRIIMRNFRGDQAERINVTPDEFWIPPDLFKNAFEISESMGKVDTALNNRNVHKGVYTINEWNYMTDSTDWFLCDSGLRKQSVKWTDRVPLEFAMAQDLDTMVAKWAGYMRYATGHIDWRWVLGHQVA